MPGHRRQPSIELLEFMGVVKENGNEQASLPPMFTPLSYDYVLVAKTIDDQERQAFKKQTEYIEELKKKNFKVTKIIDDHLVFYGIQGPKDIFQKYRYLLKVSDACNWSSYQNSLPLSTRIRVVHFILNHTPIHSGENLRDLMKAKVFEAKFCLHEKKRQKELKESWARWTACLQGQPITAVRNYFGEKVALYFLWLGWYTFLLIPPALIGILVFLYGLSYFNSSPLIQEVCESNRVMCPLCDTGCKVWKLSETCSYAKLSLLFDNNGTVLFAMFMAIWTQAAHQALLQVPLLPPAPHHTVNRNNKARAPLNATPASAHKRNRANTTQHHTHNELPDPTPRRDRLIRQEVPG
ncbi:hypothetical protein CHARACLAT_022688 [Characodon lateralis]|uniref:Anoctamin n=1 Tax=Characodon lateralis TaxID=208331 RepID=A0ABU7EVW8_9TELE|nr:hypothetical protein [Characodon lateralis]